jgi:hypothetical protein
MGICIDWDYSIVRGSNYFGLAIVESEANGHEVFSSTSIPYGQYD